MNTKQETLGLWLGVLGVAIFAVTLPMTRLATGTAADPQLSAWFITFARAALAGGLSEKVTLPSGPTMRNTVCACTRPADSRQMARATMRCSGSTSST